MFPARLWPLVISVFLFDGTFLLVLPALLLRSPAPSETSKNNSNSLLGSDLKEDRRSSHMAILQCS